ILLIFLVQGIPPALNTDHHTCIVQYILFPPHSTSTKDSFSTDDDNDTEVEAIDVDTELNLVTECWVEPQSGTVWSPSEQHRHFRNLTYQEIPQAVSITYSHAHSPANIPLTLKLVLNAQHCVFMCNVCVCVCVCVIAFVADTTEDSVQSSTSLPNELLLSLFHSSLQNELSDREIPLADGDHVTFMHHILERERDGHMAPFSLPVIKGNALVPFCYTSLCDISYIYIDSPLMIICILCFSLYSGLYSVEENNGVQFAEPQRQDCRISFGRQLSQQSVGDAARPRCPVYIYNCSLESLKDQLVHPNSSHLSSSWTDLMAHPHKQKELANYCSLLQEHYYQSYVRGVYRSLQQSYSISSQDVLTAMDYCEESLQEIDITSFLQTLCGHIRTFRERHEPLGADSLKRSPGMAATFTIGEGDDDGEDRATLATSSSIEMEDSSEVESRGNVSAPTSPLNISSSSLIQDKFMDIGAQYFKTVSSNPHYFFYCPQSSKKEVGRSGERRLSEECEVSEAELATEDGNVSGCCIVSESDTDLEVEYQEQVNGKAERGGGVGGVEEGAEDESLSDSDNTMNQDEDSFSILEGDSLLEPAGPQPEMPPLFVHLVCSVSVKSSHGSMPIRTLPTCLDELISCLENAESLQSVDLNELSVTLDIFVLTLPLEIEVMPHDPHHTRYTSESSVSMNRSPGQPSSYRSDEELMENLDGLRGMTGDPLSKLPAPQKQAVLATMDEIRWLLEDEIVSALRHSSVSSSTLLKVSDHVCRSSGRPGCHHEVVPLQFVFGPEQSLEKFKEEFRRLSFPGYLLKGEKHNYHYISLSRQHSLRIQAAQQSNQNLASSQGACLISQPASHCPGAGDSPLSKGLSSGKLRPSRVQSVVSSQGSLDSDMLGYDGGSSDSECDGPTMDEQEVQNPLMPEFWLIVRIHQDRVEVFSHSREEDEEEIPEYLRLHQEVVRKIGEICRIVNQRLLLQDLHDSHVCNSLLVAESEEDIWKNESLCRHRLPNSDDYNADDSYQPRDYLAATMHFMPGHFACDVVWSTIIHIHPRLKMGPNMGVARAIQALRSVLSAFSVVNRKNMFVYQERTTKSVFYLRLSETSQTGKYSDLDGNLHVSHSVGLARSQEPLGSEDLTGSRSSLEGSRPVGQVDKHILLLVHGVGQAGPEITDELVKVLRKRLDEATLDIITVMLVRNCKLTPADVEFIQPPNSAATEVMEFSLPQYSLPWIRALAHYLRQNLLIFLHIPKYTDSNMEHHFKHYFHLSSDLPDSDIYLYNKPGGQGTGGKGNEILSARRSTHTSIFLSAPLPPFSLSLSVPDPSEIGSPKTTDDIVQEKAEDSRLARRRHKTESVKQQWSHERAPTVELETRSAPLYRRHVTQLEEGDAGSLHPLYQSAFQPWVIFMARLGRFVSITEMSSLFLLPSIVTEAVHLVSSLAPDTTVKIFERTSCPQGDIFIPLSHVQHVSQPPATSRSFIVIGRNFQQWHYSTEQGRLSRPDSCSFKEITLLVSLSLSGLQLTLYTYNWSVDLGASLNRDLVRLVQWQNARAHVVNCLLSQKMGLFHHYCFTDTPAQEDLKQEPNPFLNSTMEAEALLRVSVPPAPNKDPARLGSARTLPPLPFPADLMPFDEALRDVSTGRLLANQEGADIVARHGAQLLEVKAAERRELEKQMKIENLFVTWQQRSAQSNIPSLRFLPLSSFSRRHRSSDSAASMRERSLSTDSADSRLKEEPWLQELSHTFLQQYVQYLQSLGFILVQIRPQSPARSLGLKMSPELLHHEHMFVCVFLQQSSGSGTTAYHLQRALPGGIMLMELAFQGFYFCVKQYALECSRIPMGQTVNSQLSMLFTEECDKVRDLMHVHSFSYDFHLRVVHQYLLGCHMTLRQGYQLTSFLEDFISHHPDIPKFGRNHVFQGETFKSLISYFFHASWHHVLLHQSYTLLLDNFISGTYKDLEGLRHHDDFDVSLLVCHNAAPFEEQSEGERHLLRLRYYVIMTSQRELFPRLTADMRRFKKLPQIYRDPSDPYRDLGGRVPLERSDLFYPSPLFPLLNSEVSSARRQIQSSVEQAMGHCRRDNLWRRLFHGEHLALDKLKLSKLAFAELEELLNAVQSRSVGEIDPQLDCFLTMSPAWYQSLIKVLLSRFPQSCRHFVDDSGIQYLAVLNQKFTDCFVLVFLDAQAGKTSLKVVFREPLPSQPQPSNSPPPQLVSMYHHLESVINTACYNLWTGLL
uniref:SZT2 subunit of KICSTOR complex n=1 Tax=Astyanax mexicanus TaxID=7994 RepID=A0A8B9LKH5_ASTMX